MSNYEDDIEPIADPGDAPSSSLGKRARADAEAAAVDASDALSRLSPEPDEDLDVSEGKHPVWLVKIPKFLLQAWSAIRTDDLRLGTVRVYDPEALHEAKKVFGERTDLSYCTEPFATLEGADALAIVTEWKAFWSPDFAKLKEKLAAAVVFDGRNIYDPRAVEAAGLAYYGIGRGRSVSRPELA